MNESSEGLRTTYSSTGVDYAALDAGKRTALAAALATSQLLRGHGARAEDRSRGEPAFAFELGGRHFAFVLEGLGTKSIIARQCEDQLGPSAFANVAFDAVAAIVNDLCCIGALPLVVNAYFATGSSSWYERPDRHAALVSGWRDACVAAGATWGGGESPSLPDLVNPAEVELAGSAVGVVPIGAVPILGADLAAGDEIVLVDSSGLHANGSSLARAVAAQLPDGYQTRLASGRTLGEALLAPSLIYVGLVRALLERGIDIHYLSHITGHGLLKLMRPQRELTYTINKLPDVPEVLALLVAHTQMTPATAYSTFNMGCGFAVYCARGRGEQVVGVAAELGLAAHVAGAVHAGPRRVVLSQLDVVYEGAELNLTAPRAS
jgi:phosphoribosylformylglycinamidine cyclo-ligase